jgi:type II secretory pathway pseudopilin PulG
MNNKNIKGMTLVELIVYIALAALLLAPLVMLFQKSSQSMARGAVSTDLRMSGREILSIMYDDMRNLGFKLESMTAGPGPKISDHVMVNPTNPTGPDPTVDPTGAAAAAAQRDSSSFISFEALTGGDIMAGSRGAYDSLIFRKGVLNNNGEWNGYDIVKYAVRNVSTDKNLIREIDSVRLSPASSGTATQTLAQGVDALQFQYSPNSLDWVNGYTETTPINAATATAKKSVEYIKIYLILRNDKQVGATQTAPSIEDIGSTDVKLNQVNLPIMRERYEIVVPVPNNGLTLP